MRQFAREFPREELPRVVYPQKRASKMLQFKHKQLETDTLPDRWKIGVDREHVIVYVGLALVIGFAVGFIVSRTLTRRDNPVLSSPAAQLPARPSTTDASTSEFHGSLESCERIPLKSRTSAQCA